MITKNFSKDLDDSEIVESIDMEELITEDDLPLNNFASEKQQRLLVGSLYSSLQNQIFLAAANVGIYNIYGEPAIVPDVFISFDVQVPENWWEKQNRCYLVWKFGKTPEVVVELVSNTKGHELDEKLAIYQKMRVPYYVVYDSNKHLGEQVLRVYTMLGRHYVETTETWFKDINLGVTLWTGEFEGKHHTWLRWCDENGNVLMTGDERAKSAENRAESAENRAQILAERLRALGVDPDSI